MDALQKKTTKYQTIASAEEQHLAAMSNTATMTTATKIKSVTTKKVTNNTKEQQITECNDNGSNATASNGVQKKSKVTKKKITTTTMTTTTSAAATEQQTVAAVQQLTTTTTTAAAATTINESSSATVSEQSSTQAINGDESSPSPKEKEVTNGKKKTKGKKSKNKTETDQQNISVKSSFSKFDALQKKNLIHVRSSDAGKAQEKFSQPQGEKETNCRLCSKPVYKMEEVKAEKSIYHKNCLRCHECNKQLKVDNYQSHEGVLYCLMHFKLLLAPKCVEDNEPQKPRKHELIIRENQPAELPPDVVRASDKPDLGLEELQQLNVRSRFQVFENGSKSKDEEENVTRSAEKTVKRSSSILSKMAKLQSHGLTAGMSTEELGEQAEDETDSGSEAEHGSASEDDPDNADADLVRSKKRTQRERPVGIGKAMNDIKTRFEKGHMLTKEERREERKQEIQNIRSRLFMGKQARIKEMYQQAVADSEQSITASDKKPEIDIGGAARSIKERFEKGEMFKQAGSDNEEEEHVRSGGIQDEAAVFESAISKKSRSIFMEIDANVVAGKHQAPPKSQGVQRNRSSVLNRTVSENEQETPNSPDGAVDVVKYDEKPEDVKIETSEISSKFKFFETYRPSEAKRKQFRITPPREGVVKMPSPEDDNEDEATEEQNTNGIEKSNTTALMLNKFREMEQNKNTNGRSAGPRPLKCFTPPPDGDKRVYPEQESSQEDEDYDDEEEGEEEEEDDEFGNKLHTSKMADNDEALKEAQAAARAKQLRAKFEKWEANEVQREINEGHVNIYSQEVSDESNIESTKTIRERFENMKNSGIKSPTRPRYQVNRFV